MADLLFAVRNNFYLGAFQAAINEASDLTDGLSEQEVQERDCLVYRSYIGMGQYDIVLSEISEDSSSALLAVKLLASYLSGRLPPGAGFRCLAQSTALHPRNSCPGIAVCHRHSQHIVFQGLASTLNLTSHDLAIPKPMRETDEDLHALSTRFCCCQSWPSRLRPSACCEVLMCLCGSQNRQGISVGHHQ